MNLSKEVMKELREMIETDSFHTDSDLMDYAEEHGLSVRDVDRAVWEIISENNIWNKYLSKQIRRILEV